MTSYTAEQFERRMIEIEAHGATLVGPSLAQRFAAIPAESRDEYLASLKPIDAARLLYMWRFWSRPKQLAPDGDWSVLLILAGRGFGKNRIGAEWIRDRVERGVARSIAMIGPDWKDIRRYMVGGRRGAGGSGILDVFPPWDRPRFVEHKAEVHFRNGAIAYLNTAEQKELRGANLDTIWGDEIIKWKYAETLWSNIEMTLREPGLVPPQMLMTTTPMPIELLKEIIMDRGTVTIHGRTIENADNVATQWIDRIHRRYKGTRLGEQELEARILGDNPDALFHMPCIDHWRVSDDPTLVEVGIGIDPAVSEKRKSDDTGIIAAGRGSDHHLYVLADMTGKYSPDKWPGEAIDLAVAHGAEYFAVERNKIGDLAAFVIRKALQDRGMAGKFEIRETYSMTDKAARAAPLAALYERGNAHHVGRKLLRELESEMTTWNPKIGRSPNRLDALVHVAYELCDLATIEKPDYKAGFDGLDKVRERLKSAERKRPIVNPLRPRGRSVTRL